MSAQSAPPSFVRQDVDDVAVLRLSHGKVSALDQEFCRALSGELEGIEAAASRALVLTGTGSAFSAGVDLFRVLENRRDYVENFWRELNLFFQRLLEFPKPVVAAVNGHAIAGGCIIAAASDYRVMSRAGGRIGVPELIVGVPFPTLPLAILSARLSPASLRAVVYTGHTVTADEAVTVGFVDEAVDGDQLLARAIAVARQMSAIPASTFALTKRSLVAPVLARVAQADDTDVIRAWSSDEVHAAIRQYVERTIQKR